MCPKQTVKKSKMNSSTTDISTKMDPNLTPVDHFKPPMDHFGLSTKAKLSRKRKFGKVIKEELEFISNLFITIDVSTLIHGNRNLIEEEDDDFTKVLDVPEEKIFQKHKKHSSQQSSKKLFPKNIDGLEKELEELKGLSSLNYQQKIRKKGLHSRLVKKKRKLLKLKTSQLQKRSITVNGQIRFIKPVLNSDGNIVNNKFDFAESDVKNEKRDAPTKKKKVKTTSTDDVTTLEVQTANVQNESATTGVSPLATKPVFNKDNKMVFSKVFIPENVKKSKGPKDPKKILEKMKESSKKIHELEKKDKDKAETLKEKQKWAAALKRASGETVRDDPELLRKSIAREKNQKMRSEKKWKARLDQVQKEKDKKQNKRTANIQARKNEKKKKKIKKAVKKGRIVQV